jgi:hypothetical protein
VYDESHERTLKAGISQSIVTVTARRLRAHACSFDPIATGRSLP